MFRQLPLGVSLDDGAAFGNFWHGANGAAVHALESLAEDPGRSPACFISGPAGSGKSHLMQSVCRRLAELGRPAAYLPMAQLDGESPALLEGLEGLAAVCVDDLDRVAGNADWEQGLFGLYNRLQERGGAMAVAARAAPGALGLVLPDLASRLSWGPVFRLRALDDEGKRRVLQLRARCRGMDLPGDAARYLLNRESRSLHDLCRLLDSLDRASLAAQRRLTIPFLREALGRG